MTSPAAPRLDTHDIVVWLPLGVVTIWLVYRIARGWIRLAARQPMYA